MNELTQGSRRTLRGLYRCNEIKKQRKSFILETRASIKNNMDFFFFFLDNLGSVKKNLQGNC